MILDGNCDSGFFRDSQVGFQFFDELADGSFQFFALQILWARAAADDQFAAESLGKSHLILKTKWPKLVLSDTAKSDVVLFEQGSEFFLAHFVELLSLVAVDFRPDVQSGGSDLRNFRNDFVNGRVAVHARAEDVFRLELRRGKC